MIYNYILGLDEADMKKIRGFRLRLVNLFFPALIDVLKRTEEDKDYYLLKYKDEIELNISLMRQLNKLKIEHNALRKTIGKLKGGNSNKPKNNELEGSSEVSGN